MRIIVSGFTAAGKTTHARLLAAHFGVPYIAMLPIMTEVLTEAGREPGDAEYWSPQRDEARAADDEIDLEADRRMRERIEAGSGVFDSWALPWLYSGTDAVRVWIESDFPSRVRKCIVSELMQERAAPTDPAGLVRQKDAFSIALFSRLYGFVLSGAPDRFDLVLDNTEFIRESTVACARDGIERFQPMLVQAIEQRVAAND